MALKQVLASTGQRLQDKVAIITGGATGIGEVTAKLFSQHGCKVVIADIQDDVGRLVCQDIGSNMALFMHCDVTKEDDVKNTVDTTIAKFGKLDIMFNNAGVVDPHKPRITENELEDFERVISVNVTGVFLGIKHAARVMIPAKQGSIIINGSVSSILGGFASHSYVASKHAVVGLTKNAAAELGQFGIRVNCISSYLLGSSMASNFFKKDGNEIENLVCELSNLKGVVLDAEDIAKAAVFFGSDETKFVSGHNFVIDGGITTVNTAFGHFNS